MADEPILEKRFDDDVDVDAKMAEGGILATFYIEVQGNDKEKAQQALENTILERMAAEPNVSLLVVRFFEFEKNPDKDFFSGVAEVKLVTDDFRWLVNITMRYGPSAFEIDEPEEVTLSLEAMQSILADASGISQMLTSQLFSLLKDDERRAMYERMLSQADAESGAQQ